MKGPPPGLHTWSSALNPEGLGLCACHHLVPAAGVSGVTQAGPRDRVLARLPPRPRDAPSVPVTGNLWFGGRMKKVTLGTLRLEGSPRVLPSPATETVVCCPIIKLFEPIPAGKL